MSIKILHKKDKQKGNPIFLDRVAFFNYSGLARELNRNDLFDFRDLFF